MRLANVYIEHPIPSRWISAFRIDIRRSNWQPGMRVWVPFGKQKIIGFVDSFQELSDSQVAALSYEIREIIDVIDRQPLLNDELRALGKWMASYYVASTISCYQAMLPKVLKPSQNKAKVIYEQIAVFDHFEQDLTKRQLEVLQEFQYHSPMLAAEYRKRYKSIAKILIQKGCVRIEKREKQTLSKGACQSVLFSH